MARVRLLHLRHVRELRCARPATGGVTRRYVTMRDSCSPRRARRTAVVAIGGESRPCWRDACGASCRVGASRKPWWRGAPVAAARSRPCSTRHTGRSGPDSGRGREPAKASERRDQRGLPRLPREDGMHVVGRSDLVGHSVSEKPMSARSRALHGRRPTCPRQARHRPVGRRLRRVTSTTEGAIVGPAGTAAASSDFRAPRHPWRSRCPAFSSMRLSRGGMPDQLQADWCDGVDADDPAVRHRRS
jgi:hypothetical protein